MIIYTPNPGSVAGKGPRIEDTNIEPMHPGIILFKYILPKIEMSLGEFILKTKMTQERAENISKGSLLLSDGEINQLKHVFPKAWRLLRDVQRDYVYFKEKGAWRPLGAPRKVQKPVKSR